MRKVTLEIPDLQDLKETQEILVQQVKLVQKEILETPELLERQVPKGIPVQLVKLVLKETPEMTVKALKFTKTLHTGR